MTYPVGSLAPSSAAAMQNAAGSSEATLAVDRKDRNDKDTFLKLLVAQMRFQDPSKPTDSSQLMAQTATFTQVEKLDELAKSNAALLASQRSLSAGAMVGRSVTYADPTDGSVKAGRVSSVVIATDAKEAQAVIGGVVVPLSRITAVSES